jgi:preprotein translocase subunit SecA
MLADKLRQIFHRTQRRRIELDLTSYCKLLAQIDAREGEFRRSTDSELKERSRDLVSRARAGVTLDNLLIEAYALVREVAGRTIGLRPFEVQMLGGIALHQGKLIEMQTGEGKTLVALLPVYLNALTGQGAHVLTFNDYLARRDAQWMGPVYRFLGLTIGFVQEGMSPQDRRQAYNCAITYVTAKEAGFDYLRDHICLSKDDLVHRPFHFALVDEADSILIDEARVPLVIAGNTDEVVANPYEIAEFVRTLKRGLDYDTDENERNAYFTDAGLDRAEKALHCENLTENIALLGQLYQALHAQVLLARDVDYIVRDGQIEIVDEFTGRVVENRHWPHGLQAAVEAKEGLRIQAEGLIRGSITLIHFARLYPRLCGMTATAQAAAEEFTHFYNLPVVVIPPHRPSIRVDAPDLVFVTKEAKERALVREIAAVHATGRPILVGTSSVAESDHLAESLREHGVDCQVLNAKNDELEAEIVAEAGAPGAVTISTNMAGRGTDIRLGGRTEQHHAQVAALGGLYVIGTNRHESRRVDDQLRGRAARQGDPGSSRFFISLRDDLLQRFGIDEFVVPEYQGRAQDEPVGTPQVTEEIAHVQRVIEGQNLEIRRTLWQYSYAIEHQRNILHTRRQDLLTGRAAPHLLAERASPRHQQLLSQFGPEVLERVERQITLFHIDRCWAEYLDYAAHLRAGIHLISAGGSPLDKYHIEVGRAFRQLVAAIEESVVATFQTVNITAAGIDMEKEGLKGPTSTWTYLINDHPFGDWFQRFYRTVANSRDLVKSLRRALTDYSTETSKHS